MSAEALKQSSGTYLILLHTRLTGTNSDVYKRQPVLRFTIAVNRRMKRDETDFIDCVAFRQNAELISKFFRKGSAIIVFGSIQVSNYTDRELSLIHISRAARFAKIRR